MFYRNHKPLFIMLMIFLVSAVTAWAALRNYNPSSLLVLGDSNLSITFGPYFYDPTGTESHSELMIVKNGTSMPVEIEKIRKSCGCVQNIVVEKRELAPQGSTDITFDVTPKGSLGAKLVNFIFQAEDGSQFPCKMELIAYPTYHFPDGSQWFFSSTENGANSKKFEVVTFGASANDLTELVSVASGSKSVELGVKGSNVQQLKNGVYCRKWNVTATRVPNSFQGNSSSNVDIVLQDGESKELIKKRVRLTVSLTGSLVAEPSGVFVGSFVDGKFSKEVRIKLRNGKAFQIQRIECGNEKLILDFDNEIAKSHTITIHGSADDFGEQLLEEVQIQVEGTDGLTVRVAGVFKPSSKIPND